MHNSYVDGFCLKLENILDREKIKEVANLLLGFLNPPYARPFYGWAQNQGCGCNS